MNRTVIGNIFLSLDGRVTGPAGVQDMGWIVPHALTGESRGHLLKITSTASTALLGRRNYLGFAGFWPAVAGDESADPRDRAFARWLNEAESAHDATASHFPVVAARQRRGRFAPGSAQGICRRSRGRYYQQVDLATRACASSNEVSSRVGDEAAILDLDAGVYYALDPVGARIFELLQQPARLGDVLSTLLAEYEIDEETARGDLLAFVGDLQDKRLVVLTDAP